MAIDKTARAAIRKARGARFDQALAAVGKTKQEISDALGIKWHNVNQYSHGSLPNGDRLLDLARLLGVDARWLSSGVGAPPRSEQGQRVVVQMLHAETPMTDEEISAAEQLQFGFVPDVEFLSSWLRRRRRATREGVAVSDEAVARTEVTLAKAKAKGARSKN